MKTAIFGMGMILALSSTAFGQRAATRGELVPATRGALPAPAARKMLNNATDRVDVKDAKRYDVKVENSGGSIGEASRGAVSETVETGAELSESKLLEVNAKLSAATQSYDVTALSSARKEVLKDFAEISGLVVNNDGSIDAYAQWLRSEVLTWDCGACVVGYNSKVQEPMKEIVKGETSRGNEITLARAMDTALIESKLKDKTLELCKGKLPVGFF
jgi:hypothetical protein